MIDIGDDVTLFEFPEDELPFASLKFNVPLGFKLYGIRDLANYQFNVLEDIRHRQSTLFQLIAHLGDDLSQDDLSGDGVVMIGEAITLLGKFGEGLCDAVELANMSFETHRKSLAEKPEAAK